MPWKNGGGETREVIVSPPHATLESLDWRISLATVATDGPFSSFEGVERTLCVIRGAGIRLRVGDAPAAELTTESSPFYFRGDAPVHASLVDGPIVDLNVMSRLGRAQHRVQRLRITGDYDINIAADVWVAFCLSGPLAARTSDAVHELGVEDSLVIEEPAPLLRLSSSQVAEVCVVEICASVSGNIR